MLQLLSSAGRVTPTSPRCSGSTRRRCGRARAPRSTELAGADPDHRVGLTDYLLGQADPIGRADAIRHLKDDPADLDLATEIAQKIRLVAPAAELPRLPGEERRPRPPRAPGAVLSRLPIPVACGPGGRRTRPPRAARAPWPRRREARARACPGARPSSQWGSAAPRVLLVMIVLGVAGAFSSGSDDGGTPSTTTGTTTNAANTGRQGFPLTQIGIDNSGRFQDTFAIRKGLQPLLPQTPAVYVTLARKEGGHQRDQAGRQQRTTDLSGEG